MSGRFSGRVALVAGGTGGLGRSVTLAFLVDGADVVVTYRGDEELERLRQEAGQRDSLLHAERADVTDGAVVRALVEGILARHGRLDFLINAVGGYAGGSKLWEGDVEVLDRMLDLNLRSGHALCRAAAPAMLRQGHGSIVNVASRAALEPAAGQAAYAASKAAAVAMMGSLAADLAGTAVRVNSVLPSIIDTAANRKAMPKADYARWPKPEDIARVILFLCSDEARVVHGAAIPVYGNL